MASNRRTMTDRRTFLAIGSATLATAGFPSISSAQTGEPVLIGVCGPLTGQYAQYGAQWKKGFDLALDEINGAGGIAGRPLKYVFEDSQSDPRQTVNIARKFVSDDKIIVAEFNRTVIEALHAAPHAMVSLDKALLLALFKKLKGANEKIESLMLK